MILGIPDHQMIIQRNFREFVQSLAVIRAEGEIGHEIAVHHVDMQIFDAAVLEDAQGFRKRRDPGGLR